MSFNLTLPASSSSSKKDKKPEAGGGKCTYQSLCRDRGNWWFNVGVAIMVLCGLAGIVGLVVASVFATHAFDATTQQRYAFSHRLSSLPLNVVLTGSSPVQGILPNDLSPFVGKHYTVDCETFLGHQVVIEAGPLPSFWGDPVNSYRTATCTNGAPRAGFSFRVVSASHVRITEQSNMIFSA